MVIVGHIFYTVWIVTGIIIALDCRIARACGATIVHRPEEASEADIGTRAGLFEVKKIGDEFFAFIVDCEDPKACTILLR